MTPDELCHAASVMLAAANGKRIDFRQRVLGPDGRWFGPNDPDVLPFDWCEFEYRVSPNQPSDQEKEE